MSFDRYRAQVLCESFLGCTNFGDFFTKSHADIEGLTLNSAGASSLSVSLKEDSKDLYYKGCLSLSECLTNYSKKRYSWAIIKGYYATFYFIKADFGLRDYALFRHKCIYYLKANTGATPITKGRNGVNRTEYSGDHKSAINYYRDLFSNSDVLLSQEIEGLQSYHWLMKKREQVNYQERSFSEPTRPDFLEYIDERILANQLDKLVEEIYNDDKYLLTFQPEYAPLAIPLKRALLTRKSFMDHGITDILKETESKYLDVFGRYKFE